MEPPNYGQPGTAPIEEAVAAMYRRGDQALEPDALEEALLAWWPTEGACPDADWHEVLSDVQKGLLRLRDVERNSPVSWLLSVPATDDNFRANLERATDVELLIAFSKAHGATKLKALSTAARKRGLVDKQGHIIRTPTATPNAPA